MVLANLRVGGAWVFWPPQGGCAHACTRALARRPTFQWPSYEDPSSQMYLPSPSGCKGRAIAAGPGCGERLKRAHSAHVHASTQATHSAGSEPVQPLLRCTPSGTASSPRTCRHWQTSCAPSYHRGVLKVFRGQEALSWLLLLSAHLAKPKCVHSKGHARAWAHTPRTHARARLHARARCVRPQRKRQALLATTTSLMALYNGGSRTRSGLHWAPLTAPHPHWHAPSTYVCSTRGSGTESSGPMPRGERSSTMKSARIPGLRKDRQRQWVRSDGASDRVRWSLPPAHSRTSACPRSHPCGWRARRRRCVQPARPPRLGAQGRQQRVVARRRRCCRRCCRCCRSRRAGRQQ